MKKHLVVSAILAVCVLVFLPLLNGCDVVVGAETTATLGEADSDTVAADAAIAAVTQSAAIEVPATIVAGSLQAGSDVAFPPLVYLAVVEETQGEEVKKVTKAVGFEVDLCTAIAKKMGLTLGVVSTRWDDVVPALIDRKVDMVMSAVLATPELQQEVGLTDPHLPCVLAISAPLTAPVTDLAGLTGKTVGVQEDTVSHSFVLTVDGVAEVKTYTSIVKAFADLADGRIQAVVEDEIVSRYILNYDPELKSAVAVGGTITTGSGYSFATRKDDTVLLSAVNAALAELRAEGVYQKICAKWDVTGN